MRISDWSSDVCSSDLRAIRRVALHIDALDAAAIDEIVDVASAPRRRQRGVDVALVQPEHRELLLIDVDMDGRHIGTIAWPHPDEALIQIGRAASREKVCQYV